jgi:hypothetical protein
VECLILLSVVQRSVVLTIFAFSLVALFFFFLVVFFLPMIVVVVVVLRQLLSFLRVFSCWYRDHNLEVVLLLRNVLRGVELRLWWGWYIPGRQVTNGQTPSALAGCATRMNHLKFGNMRE